MVEFKSSSIRKVCRILCKNGVDFIVKVPGTTKFYEVQVKSVRDYGYVFISKSKMPVLTSDRLVCYLHFLDDQLPDVFVIPATAWDKPNAVLVERNYDKPGQTSKPEWGINISKKNFRVLDSYKADNKLKEILNK